MKRCEPLAIVIVDEDREKKIFFEVHHGWKRGGGIWAASIVTLFGKRRISPAPRETGEKERGFAGGINRSY